MFDSLGCNFNINEWRLFIDGSKYSLNAVLVHVGNKLPSLPIAYYANLSECYDSIKVLLDCINYQEFSWRLCENLKVVALLLGLQLGNTKYPCFLCYWDSRDCDAHYVKKVWPKRENFNPGSKNVLHEPLVDPKNILLPPLHIKLGLMKNFVKALPKDGKAF